MPVVGSTWTIGLSAPGGLVNKDHRCEALCVRFIADDEDDASEGGGGEGGEGEAVGESIILYMSSKCKFRLQTNIDINSSLCN